MKKSLIIALMLLSINVFAQEVSIVDLHVYKFNSGIFNRSTNQYDMGDIIETSMQARINTNVVYINNKPQSTFILRNPEKQSYDNSIAFLYDAIDQDSKKCVVRLIKFYNTDNIQIWTYYDDLCLVWYAEIVK